jgi:hypothetical protein
MPRARPAPILAPKEVRTVTLTRKDAAATALTILAVLAFFATHEGWNVWLIGDSHRWAAAAIALLGIATCGQGSPDKGRGTRFLAALGILAFVLAVVSIATGSLTPLSLLVVDIVLLWAFSTARHAFAHHTHEPPKPVSA